MRRARALVLAGCLVAAACSTGASTGGFELAEFGISGPGDLVTGSDGIEVTNTGSLPHTLVITDSSGQVVAATELIQPGETTVLEVDLEDGRYSFTCRVVAQNGDGEIVDHFEMGMSRMVDVGG